MKALFLDIFSGLSGDMFVGALLDLGVQLPELEARLAALGIQGYHLHATRGLKQEISGTKFDVHAEAHVHEASASGPGHPATPGHAHGAAHAHDEARDFRQISSLIERSSLSPWVKEKAVAVFRRIAQAEGRIHGVSPAHVHFHEVGAWDSIVDIVGACVALELLGCPQVFAGPVVDGTGWLHCAHGRFPIPAPATLEILAARGVAVTQSDEPHELLTPTGAALLAEFAQGFGPMPALRMEKVGYGLGTRDLASRPNVVRAVLGELVDETAVAPGGPGWETDQVMLLETNLDDISPEVLGHFLEQAMAQGALDVFHTPIQMKKSRPGIMLSLLCEPKDADRFGEALLRETSAFGFRQQRVERRKLAREFVEVATEFGPVTVKLGRLRGRIAQVAPEYESCRAVADRARVPVRTVFAAALRAAPKPGVA